MKDEIEILKIICIEEAMHSSGIKNKSLLTIIRRDGYSCKHCHAIATELRYVLMSNGGVSLKVYGINVNFDSVMLTVDHIKPKSKGGKNCLSNYQMLCVKCNQKKGCKDEHNAKKN